MSVPIDYTALPHEAAQRRMSRLLPYLLLCTSLWLSVCDGRVPSFLSPTVERTLYFKLPIDGTRFHWKFFDRRAFLSGGLTLRIVNTGRDRATAVGDSVILTLTALEDLRGRGPYSQGTLAAGRWVATGTYKSLYGGTLNPLRDLVRAGRPPIAVLECWDTTWVLQDASDNGWMGPKPSDEDSVSFVERLKPERGVDGRRCRSTI